MNVTIRILRPFEHKMWRMICESVRYIRTKEWRKKFNKEQEELGLASVTSYIRG